MDPKENSTPIRFDENKGINKDMIVALKKLHNSQDISDEFLNEVNYFININLIFKILF